MSKSATAGLVAIAALLLWGCSSDKNAVEKTGGCPNGAVLAEASTVTKLKPGSGKDPTDVIMTAELGAPKLSCDYDKDSGKVDVSLSFPVTVKRGPAGANAQETLSYFVALVDSDNNVLSKQAFTRNLTLDSNLGNFSESPEGMAFTVAKGKKPIAYEVLVGFQLTRDELAYNRAQHRYLP